MPVTPHSRQTSSTRVDSKGFNRKASGAVALLVMLCLTGCGGGGATAKSSTAGNTPYKKGFAAGVEFAESYVSAMKRTIELAKQQPAVFKDNVANLRSEASEKAEMLRNNASMAKASYEERKRSSSTKDEDSRSRLETSADNAEFTRGQYEGFVSLVKPYL